MKKYVFFALLGGMLLRPAISVPGIGTSEELEAIDISCWIWSDHSAARMTFDDYRLLLHARVLAYDGDPAAVEAAYNNWAAWGLLDVLHRIIRLSVRAKLERPERFANPYCWNSLVSMEQFLSEFAKSIVIDSQRQYEPGSDTRVLYLVRWKLRFVEPFPGIAEKLAAIEGKISYYEQRVALAQEVESIESQLQQNIERGLVDTRLEDRIAQLPAQEREAVEQLRKQSLDKKAKELAEAQAQQERAERVLRRQKELDQAIAWRKEEIDTRRPNPGAEAQRQKDPALAEAVATWEQAYRKELAERKAEEARRLLAEKRREAEERFNSTTAATSLWSQMRKLQSERDKADRQVRQIEAQHPLVKIVGKIKDRERNAILVWGRALPVESTDLRTFGVLLQDSNIVVLNPERQWITMTHYAGALHYFLRKDSGPNAFGVNVPVWVYGDKPSTLASAETNRIEVERRYRELEAQYQRLKQEYISKAVGATE